MEQLYISQRIAEKLARIHNAGLTVLEAPAGYGKTTAVHWEMSRLPAEQVHWYTAVSFYQDSSIEWLFHQIGKQNRQAGEALRALGFLNRSNVYDAADILTRMEISEPLYLIFDNFQIVRANWSPVLLQALADRQPDGLHVLFLSQNFGRLRISFEHSPGVERFRARDFLLTRQEIRAYGARLGRELSEQESLQIFRDTEGWAAAVYLYLEQLCRQEMPVKHFQNMDGLLYEFFWSRLTEQEQRLLLRVAVFECIQQEHLSQVAPGQEGELYNILVRAPLMHRDPRTRSGYPHELLRNFLQDRLGETEPEFQSLVYAGTGDICCRMGLTQKAVQLYFRAGQDEKLLSCDLTGLLGEDFGGLSFGKLARQVLERSPLSLLRQHPIALLQLCLALFGDGDFAVFDRWIQKARDVIEELGDPQLMGEWHLTAAFRAFPSIPDMQEYYAHARDLMVSASRIFTPREPFMFGTTSMWYLFYRTPGKMLETAEALGAMLELYDSCTDHHGAGARELYLSEALSVQGRFSESELAAHRAAVQAEQWQNATVTYGVALVLGIDAIYQSDMISLQKAVEYLENHALAYPFLQKTALNTQMAETVRTYLLGLMMEPDRSAPWARGTADLLGDLTLTNFMAKTNRITDLILRKEYKRAIASVEASLQLDSRLISLSTRNFMCVGLALCYLAIGNVPRAAEWLEQSLTLAEQDRNYTFLACFRKYLSVLFLLPGIQHRHARAIREIRALPIHYTKAEESRIFAVLDENPDQMEELTDREREVAQLVAEGLRNKEIAQQLCISQETVKSHIRSIFTKTNIDRRSKLVELLK